MSNPKFEPQDSTPSSSIGSPPFKDSNDDTGLGSIGSENWETLPWVSPSSHFRSLSRQSTRTPLPESRSGATTPILPTDAPASRRLGDRALVACCSFTSISSFGSESDEDPPTWLDEWVNPKSASEPVLFYHKIVARHGHKLPYCSLCIYDIDTLSLQVNKTFKCPACDVIFKFRGDAEKHIVDAYEIFGNPLAARIKDMLQRMQEGNTTPM